LPTTSGAFNGPEVGGGRPADFRIDVGPRRVGRRIADPARRGIFGQRRRREAAESRRIGDKVERLVGNADRIGADFLIMRVEVEERMRDAGGQSRPLHERRIDKNMAVRQSLERARVLLRAGGKAGHRDLAAGERTGWKRVVTR
jgi:hypothetical protein